MFQRLRVAPMAQAPFQTHFEEVGAKMLGTLESHTNLIKEMLSSHTRKCESFLQTVAERVRDVMDERDQHSVMWDKRLTRIESLLLEHNQRISVIASTLQSSNLDRDQLRVHDDVSNHSWGKNLDAESFRDHLWPPILVSEKLEHPGIGVSSFSSAGLATNEERPASRTTIYLEEVLEGDKCELVPPSYADEIQEPVFQSDDDDDENARSENDQQEPEDLSDVNFDGVCTVMIKNVPCRCSHEDILQAISDVGFGDEPMSFHVPARFKKGRKGSNLGYAFVSFSDSEVTARFVKALNGYAFKHSKSNKRCVVVPAHQQGVRLTAEGNKSLKPLHFSV